MRKNAEPAPAIWLARGKNQNISVKRAMTFLSLARTWTLLAYEKDQLAAIEKEEGWSHQLAVSFLYRLNRHFGLIVVNDARDL